MRKLLTVQFADARHGWAAGSSGIFATSNGGKTWSRQHGEAEIVAIDFADTRHGWAVAGDQLLFTTDGRSWSARSVPCLIAVHFVNTTLGWGVALRKSGTDAPAFVGDLVTTQDEGRSWTRASAPEDVQSVCFTDAQQGWLGAAGSVYRTHDGGRTWRKSFADPHGRREQRGSTAQVECAGSTNVWVEVIGWGVALSHEPHAVFVGGDGMSWRTVYVEPYTNAGPLPIHAPDSPGSYPGSFSAISPSEAAFVDQTPPIGYGEAEFVESRDGGATLTRQTIVPDITTPTGMSFTDADHGVVVGMQNTQSREFALIEQTSDGGRRWQQRLRLG